jgi:hypothetical protein
MPSSTRSLQLSELLETVDLINIPINPPPTLWLTLGPEFTREKPLVMRHIANETEDLL